MFGSGGGSTVFSLSKERELVKSQERKSKARGRGRIHPTKPPQVGGARDRVTPSRYPAPKPGSGGITVIEPLDKGEDVSPDVTTVVDTSQFETENVSAVTVPDDLSGGQPGLPLRGAEDSAGGVGLLSTEAELGGGGEEEEKVPTTAVPEPDGGQGPPQPWLGGGERGVASHQEGAAQLPMSKPKRYSSQRQKAAGEVSGLLKCLGRSGPHIPLSSEIVAKHYQFFPPMIKTYETLTFDGGGVQIWSHFPGWKFHMTFYSWG